jgi:simple sugar transport system substrate-binding protein
MLKRLSVLGLLAVLAVTLFVLPGLAQSNEKPLVVYFFPGGNPGGVYAARVYNGAAHAAEILGDRVDMHYLWSDWNPQKMVSQFQEALAANPDGIAIMGHPGDEALEPFVDEAIEKGIVVTTMDTTLPMLEEEYKMLGFGFVGEEQYAAGYKLASEAVRVAGLEEGDKAIVYGILREPTRGQATRGAIDALEEAGLEVSHLEISQAADSDPTQAIPTISGYLQKNPDIDLFLTDHSNMTSNLQAILEVAGVGPDDFFVAGMGLSVAQLDAIKAGYLDIVMNKQPFLQGFLAVFQIYLSKSFAFSGLHIPTGSGFITLENVDEIAPLVEQGYH